MQVYENCKLEITRNLDVDKGLVNGCVCDLVAVRPFGLEVRMQDGSIEHVYRRAEKVDRCRSAFDVRLGYSCTVHKVEGSTLPAAIICWEDWAPPGWGYTALSRVKTLETVRFVGYPQVRHFIPREKH